MNQNVVLVEHSSVATFRRHFEKLLLCAPLARFTRSTAADENVDLANKSVRRQTN
jgi:hypothetical protein